MALIVLRSVLHSLDFLFSLQPSFKKLYLPFISTNKFLSTCGNPTKSVKNLLFFNNRLTFEICLSQYYHPLLHRTSDTSFICCFPSCLTRRNRGKWRSEHMKHQEEPRKCQGKQCAPRVLYPSGGFQRRVCIVFPGGGLRWVLLLLCSHRLPTSQRGFASLVCLHCPLNSGLSLLADSFEVLIPA